MNVHLALLALAAATNAAAEPVDTRTECPGLSVQVAFTPGNDAAQLIIGAIDAARREIYVQAYSFTHRDIADALIRARGRGVTVRIIADARQAEQLPTSLVDELAAAGMAITLDAEHDAAHNKVMIMDPGTAAATVVTGSYNFSHAAEFRNAENVLVLRGCRDIAGAYLRNWLRHRVHAHPALKP